MFLKTILIPSICPVITSIVVPPETKLPSGFSNILFARALARKKINQAFIVTIKLMIDFKCFSSDSASTSIRFTCVNTYLTSLFTATLDPTILFIGYSLALTK